jgi:acetylornithine deacetylase
VNAIYRMAELVRHLSEYASDLNDSKPDPVLGPASLSVGRIEGGTSVNVVPDWCEIEVDRRVIPGEVAAGCIKHVESYLRERLPASHEWEFLPPWVNMPALAQEGTRSSEWIAEVQTAVAQATGRAPALGGVPYGTDAGPLGATGLPCLVFGPGDIAQAHTKDEWIELVQVQEAAEAYFQIACALG